MHPIFEKYFDILLKAFENDVSIMSQPWMFYTIIPILGYIIFFFAKWSVLTAPMWIPFSIIVGVGRKNKKQKSK